MSNRVLYSAICIGELYSYWACICLRSFKDLVSEPVTWEICTTEEWKDKLEEKLSDFKAEGFTFIFTIMSSVSDEVDIDKYISLGWTLHSSADYFMWRVNHLDDNGLPIGDVDDWWWYASNYIWANFPPLYWGYADLLN